MSRFIDVDALINDVTERYCKDCERRKGIKNGKQKFIYDIGEAPCKACGIGDMLDELENTSTVDAIEVVRCKDCKFYWKNDRRKFYWEDDKDNKGWVCLATPKDDAFCSEGERIEDDEIQHP